MNQEELHTLDLDLLGETPPPQEDLHPHLVSNFQIVPFAVQLFQGTPLGMGHQHIALDSPDLLTQEAVEALAEIAKQATLQFLCRRGGWQQQPFTLPHEENPQRGRLWDQRVWSDLHLAFTSDSINLLLAIFNLTRRFPKQNPPPIKAAKKTERKKEKTPYERFVVRHQKHKEDSVRWLKQYTPKSNGDLLLHHLIFRQLYARHQFERYVPVEPFANNPLNVMTHFALFAPHEEEEQPFERLLEPDFRPLLPWLTSEWVVQWLLLEPRRWDTDLEGFNRFNLRQRCVFTAWCALADDEEHWDLLLPLVDYYHKLLDKRGPKKQWLSTFQAMIQGLRIVERQAHSALWAGTFLPAREIKRAYDQARILHPIDREAPQRLFMDEVQRLVFDEDLHALEDLIEELLPTLG